MLNNIKIFTSDKYWAHILSDLGAKIVDSPNVADVIFDDIDIKAPISVSGVQNIVLKYAENRDIIERVFGKDIVLSNLGHKIIVVLYKNPNITMSELKNLVGLSPDITSHTVENTVYQLRKTYGHDIIINDKGRYRIGHI